MTHLSETAQPSSKTQGNAGKLFRRAGSVVWAIVRLPALLILVSLEPLVAFCLGALVLLGMLVAAFLVFSSAIPHFHWALMLGMSIGCGVLLVAYHGLIRLISC